MDLQIRGMVPLIQVFDMPRSLHFYRDQLGFAVIATSGNSDDCGWAHLRLHGTELMLNTAYDVGKRPPSPDSARVRAHDDTALFFTCADVDAVYWQLRGIGLEVKDPEIQSYGMKQIYLKDPDGYILCFQTGV